MDSSKADIAERGAHYEHGPNFNFEFQENHVKLEIPECEDQWEIAELNPRVVS